MPTGTHGSYIVETPKDRPPRHWLVGFHGYGENARTHLHRLRRITDGGEFLLCSVQSLHLFYNTRRHEVVGSWMTREQRLLAIEDNLAYVRLILDQLEQRFGPPRSRVLAGFSQGVAMAYRVAARFPRCCQGLIALAGDVPPDVSSKPAGILPPILLGRGHDDQWYSETKLESDLEVLRRLQAPVELCRFQSGHEWTEAFHEAAAGFLRHHIAGRAASTPRRGEPGDLSSPDSPASS